jgi:hypothetical protein
VSGDPGRLREWLGGEELPIRVTDGAPAVCAVGLSTAHGELVIA